MQKFLLAETNKELLSKKLMAYTAIGIAGDATEFRSKILEVWSDLVAVTYGETPGASKEKSQEQQWREDYAKIRTSTPKIELVRDEGRKVTGVILKDLPT